MATGKKKATTARRARNLLIELGTEELPPKALHTLGEAFANSVYDYLVEAGVAAREEGNMRFFASPRRLAVWIRQVAPVQQDRIEERKGPSLKAAFDDDGKGEDGVVSTSVGGQRDCK